METSVIDDKYVEEELKKEAEAFASENGENTGFCLRGLCGQDVSKIDMSNLSTEMFKRLTYDSKTKFSQEQIEKFHPDIIMEQGKQFGNIGESEIDGSGTTIAIIDRFSDISAKQFDGRTITVYRVSKDGVDKEPLQPNEKGIYLEGASVEEGLENGFHGNTIDSLTVGKECGVAPKANVILFHVDGIENQEAQDAVLKFIDENREEEFTIPDIISVSDRTDIKEQALIELERLGCAFINSDIFMKDFTWGRSNNSNELVRDEFIEYALDALSDETKEIYKEVFDRNTLIPVTGRTSSYINDDGEEVYKFNGSFCGNSFAICQVAGLFLLARQIQPQISYGEFIKAVKESQKENSEHRKYIDPKDIIEKIKENKEKNETKREPLEESKSTQTLGKETISAKTQDKDKVEQAMDGHQRAIQESKNEISLGDTEAEVK